MSPEVGHPRGSIVWRELAQRVLAGYTLSRQDAVAILEAEDDELLELMHSAFQIRKAYFGKKVKLNMIINAKSGFCPEDCHYCSQSVVSEASIEKYPLVGKGSIVAGAKEAIRRKAGTYCIVMSGRRPSNREVEEVAAAVEAIKAHANLKICACLGLLSQEHAQRLFTAGVDRYNHNLNTSRENYEAICSTHTYSDRVDTVETAKAAGLSPCSGAIFGMGEGNDGRVEMAFTLRNLDVDSIPCNFLNPISGTLLEGQQELTPTLCLKILVMMRFVNPTKEIRVSGGRELNLGHLQALSLYAANAIFVGDYLTTKGLEPTQDWQMIRDLGFEVDGYAL